MRTKKRYLFMCITMLYLITMVFSSAYVCAADNDLIPNGEEYFGKANPDSGSFLSGVMALFAIVIGAIGIIGLLRTILYISSMVFKMMSGKDMGKQGWKTAGIAFVVFALLTTGGWYSAFKTINKVGLDKAVKTFTKDRGDTIQDSAETSTLKSTAKSQPKKETQ